MNLFDKLFKKRVIVNCFKQPYLSRWYLIRTIPIAVFLHYFHRSDEDRELHDHPWNFITVPLWRGYLEHTEKDCKRIRPGTICWRPAEWKHRVELIAQKPAVTIVVRFKERRIWGFWKGNKFTPWNIWWQNNCE